MPLRLGPLGLLLLTAAGQPLGSLERVADLSVSTEGLRSSKGVVHFCLTQTARRFLDCQKDPRSTHLTVAAQRAGRVVFHNLAPGDYALVAFHDENRNARLDMTLGVPREGFAFSNNPVIRVRAPTFAEVRFGLAPGSSAQSLRFRYVL